MQNAVVETVSQIFCPQRRAVSITVNALPKAGLRSIMICLICYLSRVSLLREGVPIKLVSTLILICQRVMSKKKRTKDPIPGC